jgi:hypothetical protein
MLVYVKNKFLDHGYEMLTEAYLEDVYNYVDKIKEWTFIRNGYFTLYMNSCCAKCMFLGCSVNNKVDKEA